MDSLAKDFEKSFLAGSEEIFDLFCEPCSTENQNLEAVAYCTDCQEYLCDTCYRCHRRLAATRKHKILDKSEMNDVAIATGSDAYTISDEVKETCLKHAGKALTYYCCKHTEVCCDECLETYHRKCELMNVKEIPERVAESTDYSRVKYNFQVTFSKLKNRLTRIKTDRESNEQMCEVARTNMADFRREINEFLDNLEIETVRKVSELKEKNEKLLKKEEEACQSLLFDKTQMLARIGQFVDEKRNIHLYAAVQRELERPSKLEEICSVDNEDKITRYEFRHDEKVKEIMSALSSMWTLSFRMEGTPTKASYIRDINIKSDDDGPDCSITGIATLGENRFVVVDFPNKAIKLIDMRHDTIVSKMKLSSEPFDVTSAGNQQAAVALANERKIGIFNVSDKLSVNEYVDVPGAVIVSLCFDGNRFIAACQHPGSVKIIERTGRVLSTFETTSDGEKLFIMPRYVAVSTIHQLIYVSDHNAHTVTCMTTGGTVVSVYKHDRLKLPRGLAVGEDGSVYVCVYETNTIHQLSSSGQFQKIFLGAEQGLATFPPAIALGSEESRLYISSNSRKPTLKNFVKVFQLE